MYDNCHAWHFLILGDSGLVKEMPSGRSHGSTKAPPRTAGHFRLPVSVVTAVFNRN